MKLKKIIISLLLFSSINIMAEDTFVVGSYNLYMLPFQRIGKQAGMFAKLLGTTFGLNKLKQLDTNALKRAEKIPEQIAKIPELDVIVFQEGFNKQARKALIKGMKKRGFSYKAGILKRKNLFDQIKHGRLTNSGLFALSRYPIVKTKGIFYQDVGIKAHASNNMADKGAYYIKVIKNGKPYHIITTHTEAGGRTKKEKDQGVKVVPNKRTTGGKARLQQFRAIRKFIRSLKIPDNELVVVAGDCNVDSADPVGRPDRYYEYTKMAKELGVTEVPRHPDSIAYTSPGKKENSKKKPGWIDYIFYSKKHFQPKKAWVMVQDQFEKLKLSDHLPLVGYFSC